MLGLDFPFACCSMWAGDPGSNAAEGARRTFCSGVVFRELLRRLEDEHAAQMSWMELVCNENVQLRSMLGRSPGLNGVSKLSAEDVASAYVPSERDEVKHDRIVYGPTMGKVVAMDCKQCIGNPNVASSADIQIEFLDDGEAHALTVRRGVITPETILQGMLDVQQLAFQQWRQVALSSTPKPAQVLGLKVSPLGILQQLLSAKMRAFKIWYAFCMHMGLDIKEDVKGRTSRRSLFIAEVFGWKKKVLRIWHANVAAVKAHEKSDPIGLARKVSLLESTGANASDIGWVVSKLPNVAELDVSDAIECMEEIVKHPIAVEKIQKCFQKTQHEAFWAWHWAAVGYKKQTGGAFELREAWRDVLQANPLGGPRRINRNATGNMKNSVNRDRASGASQSIHRSESSYVMVQDEKKRWPDFSNSLVLSPDAPSRIAWDVMGAILLMWDCITIPMMLLDPPRSNLLYSMEWVTMLFWTGDMFASCITGYVSKGVTVMGRTSILLHYVRYGLALDMIVVGPDWAFTIMEVVGKSEDTGATSGSKMLRALRGVRTVRLLRLVKLRRILGMIKDRINSEAIFILMNIVKLMMVLLLVNHFLACVWYAIGDFSRSSGNVNWIESYDLGRSSFEYRYFTSLHWSLTQFTPGSIDVQPQNVFERVFSIIVLLFGLVLFSSFVSSLTASITQLRTMSSDKEKQFWLLRRYLRQRGIGNSLCFRVLRYLEFAVQEQKDLVPESRVWVLGWLSSQLHQELLYEVSFKCMMMHPLFDYICQQARSTMHQLASTALSQQSFAKGEALFMHGSLAQAMYIIDSGSLVYTKVRQPPSAAVAGSEGGGDGISMGRTASKKPQVQVQDLVVKPGKGDFMCEPALWTMWNHIGGAQACTECKIVAVQVVPFGDVMRKDMIAWALVANYAERYVQWMNMLGRECFSDVAAAEEAGPVLLSFISALKIQNEEQPAQKKSRGSIALRLSRV
eukprot:TRINITY_DN8555_c0_g1_i2.p1 TRINITY_DN8555_c0_g1~~TRINITY_DN8555_c0_g1_i2.p1  ORF type:complete len:966 (-),score=151.81 TRINITY_DN8555_c0_g1_i2:44-2941(-)